MSEVGVDVKGLERLARKLRDDEPINQTMNNITQRAAEAGMDAAIQDLQGRGTGMAARTIHMGPDKFNPFSHRVFTILRKRQFQSMLEGRPVGTTLSSRKLAMWLFGIRSQRKMNKLRQSEREQLFEAQDAIQSGGARPVPLRDIGRKAAKKSLEQDRKEAEGEIVRRLQE